MSRGASDGCDRAATTPPLRCGSASAVSFAGGQATRLHTPGGSRNFGYSAFSWGALRGVHAPMEKSSASGALPSGFGAVVSRSDSAWDAFNESPEFPHSAAVPIASPNRPHSKVEGCRSAALSAKSIDTQGGSLCAGWQDHRCLPLRMLLRKFPSKNKIPLLGFSGAGPGGEVQIDAPFGFCLLTFRNREVEEKYRLKAFDLGETATDESAGDVFVPSGGPSRRLSPLASTAGPSSPPAATVSSAAAFKDPIAVAAAAAVPQSDGASRVSAAASADAALEEPSSVLGAGAPSKSRVGALASIEDKAHDLLHANMFVLLLIMTLSVVAVYSLTDFSPAFYMAFLLSLVIWGCGFANRYVCEAEHRAEFFFSEVRSAAASWIAAAAAARRAAPATAAAAATASTAFPRSGRGCVVCCILQGACKRMQPQTSMGSMASVHKGAPAVSTAVEELQKLALAALRLVKAVRSKTSPPAHAACLAIRLILDVEPQQYRTVLHWSGPLTSKGGWACMPLFSSSSREDATSLSLERQANCAALLMVLDALLLLLLQARVAAADGPSSYLSENLFVQLQAVVAELLATLAKTEALYSSRVMHALVDTAAAQRWLSNIQLPSAALLEDFSWSADASMAAPVCSQGRQQLPSSREIVYSSRLVDEGHWQSRRLASMDSSAVCSGSDWHKLPSEGVAREPLTRTNSPSFLAPAFAAAAAAAAAEVVDSSNKLSRSKEVLRQTNQHAPLSEGNVSPKHETFNTGGVDRDAAAAAGAAGAAAGSAEAAAAGAQAVVSSPPSQLLTSLARSFLAFNPSQPRKPSISAEQNRGGGGRGGGGGGLVEELLEMQIQAFKNQQTVRRQKEIANDLITASHVLYEDHRPFASPAFAGVGVDWDLDLLSLAQTHQGALQHVGFVLLRPFVDVLGCGLVPVLQLLQQLEALYDPELPYHTATHACQVAHAAMVLNAEMGLDHCKEKVGSLCLCLAALAHDVGHLGRTNGFLQQSRHPLATIYNDQSIMENFHCSLLFRIINEIPSANVFRSQSAEAYQSMRQQIIALILATDMKDHVDLMSRCRIKRSSPNFNCLRREEDAVHVRKMLLKMADLSHTLLCWRDHFTWVCKISEEFYRQGDAERRLKLPISPVCNRDCHQFLAQNQVAFMKILVEPLLCEIEGIEQAVENQKSSPPLVSGTLRTRYESNVERWTLLESSGVYIVIDNETLSRGFYRGTNSRERRSEEGGCVPGGHDMHKH
ncbi:hypothetical protein Emag_004930 [Eimeria magna]